MIIEIIAYFVVGFLLAFSWTIWYKYDSPRDAFDHPDFVMPMLAFFFFWPLAIPVLCLFYGLGWLGQLATLIAFRLRAVRK